MKLLLLNPFQVTTKGYDYEAVLKKGQYAEEPLGLGYIASYCRKHTDIDIKMLDAHIFAIDRIVKDPNIKFEAIEKEIIDIIRDYGPDLIGVSCLFHILARQTHGIIEKIKREMPEVKIVIGGSYPTASPEHALSDRNIDFAVIGEGEGAMLKILRYYKGEISLEDLDGVGYVKDDKTVIKPTKRVISNIGEFGMPERNTEYLRQYSHLGRHFFDKIKDSDEDLIATITSSRGCPFDCTFCISVKMWHRRLRFRNVEDVLDEIGILKEKFGIKFLVFNDDNMTVNRNFTLKLCNGIIDKGFDIKWSVSGGLYVPSLDEELVEIMIKSGFNIFTLAVESGSQAILNSIRKKVLLEDVIRKVDMLRKFDVYIEGYFMLGFPEETEEQFQSTIDFSSSLDLDWRSYQCVQPYPGTDLYEECLRKGLIDNDFLEDFEVLHRRSYIINPPHLSKDYVLRETYLANLKYNFLGNRNLAKDGTIDRAIRDFRWVLNMVPDHAVATYSLYKAYEKTGDNQDAEYYRKKTSELLKSEEVRKKYYLDELDVNIYEEVLN